MRGKKLDYDFLECAKNMPQLRHSTGGEFNILKSEVAKWLASQPEVMQKIFDMANRKKFIVYDSETKTWKGANT